MFNNAQQGANMLQTIFRLPAVKSESGYSRSTIYLRISQGLWTKQISLGPRCIGWPANEVSALNAARISGKTDAEIRDLVVKLEAARKAVV
ncbi:AlpA family phage regulatory protein [Rhodoferax sp.]|uniref:helix-turn-helix transcriptional regulator n=1 Tax=Rhodoferax sp. TaxID=50421 RepID=UPI00260E90DA|nr:AlpA family phage regulatory protein [Rhodoferax sp.]MDD2919318.1 AlpA family phage regulatory protein [Rhodoferax sp.]